MTTELEEQFYKTFEIGPLRHVCYRGFDNCIDNDYNCHCHNKKPCEDSHAIYPDITAEKLLEMICILGNGKDGSKNLNLYTANKDEWFAVLKDQYNLAYCAAIDKDFKNAILKLCIYRADIKDFKNQIQQLFKEEV